MPVGLGRPRGAAGRDEPVRRPDPRDRRRRPGRADRPHPLAHRVRRRAQADGGLDRPGRPGAHRSRAAHGHDRLSRRRAATPARDRHRSERSVDLGRRSAPPGLPGRRDPGRPGRRRGRAAPPRSHRCVGRPGRGRPHVARLRRRRIDAGLADRGRARRPAGPAGRARRRDDQQHHERPDRRPVRPAGGPGDRPVPARRGGGRGAAGGRCPRRRGGGRAAPAHRRADGAAPPGPVRGDRRPGRARRVRGRGRAGGGRRSADRDRRPHGAHRPDPAVPRRLERPRRSAGRAMAPAGRGDGRRAVGVRGRGAHRRRSPRAYREDKP